MFRIAFGPKQSTRLVMLLIECIAIDFITRPNMSCSLEGSQIYHTLEYLVANAIFSRRELGHQSFKANVMRVFFLDILLICNTRFIKGHKPSNHIRARIKSHVYTTECIVNHSTYHVKRYNKANTNVIYYINDKMSDTAEAKYKIR